MNVPGQFPVLRPLQQKCSETVAWTELLCPSPRPGYLQATCRAPPDPLWVIYGPPADHLRATCRHLWSTGRPPAGHLWATTGVPPGHLQATSGAPPVHLQATSGPPADHLQDQRLLLVTLLVLSKFCFILLQSTEGWV